MLNGAITPHVLRRVVDREDGVYRFIGDAYVNGMMNGEVDEMGFKEQTIVLV